MDILTSDLPNKIKVNNNIYEINCDFRSIISTLRAFEDDELTYQEKLFVMLNNLYKTEVLKEDIDEAINKAIKFIDLGKENEDDNKSTPGNRIYSFQKDANYIFSGILQTHTIDLEKQKDMHWWKFMALFMDMSSECTFGEMIYFRKRKLEGKLTKEEAKQYEKIKDIVDLDYVKKPSQARKEFFEKYHQNRK